MTTLPFGSGQFKLVVSERALLSGSLSTSTNSSSGYWFNIEWPILSKVVPWCLSPLCSITVAHVYLDMSTVACRWETLAVEISWHIGKPQKIAFPKLHPRWCGSPQRPPWSLHYGVVSATVLLRKMTTLSRRPWSHGCHSLRASPVYPKKACKTFSYSVSLWCF